MTTLREAAQLALDALHRWHWAKETTGLDAAHDALLDALFEPEQIVPSDCSDSHQPVAWMRLIDASQEARLNSVINAYGEAEDIGLKKSEFGETPTVPLYTAPPKRKWQGLTDDEIWSDGSQMGLSEDGIRRFAREIEAKLKERNK
jgi:hypothetical protein